MVIFFTPRNGRCPLSVLGTVFFASFLTASLVSADPLHFTVIDPVGDNTGLIDVTKMEFSFDNSTGVYSIDLTTTSDNPFAGNFRVNINLFNQDLGTTAWDPAFFSDTVNDFNLAAPTTTLTLSGTDLRLMAWDAGNRVFTNSLAGTGNPDNISLFRSAVNNFPLGFLTNEDYIAFADDAQPATIIGPDSTAIDHYLFYHLNSKLSPQFRGSEKIQITLADQFDGEGKVRHFFVKRPLALGNPANKNDEGILDPETHLVAYRLFPNFVKNVLKGKQFRQLPPVRVINQFGEMTLELWDLPNRLLVPSAKSLEGPVEPLEDPPIDHFQCYGIRTALGFEKQQVSVVDQFEDPKDIKLVRPRHFCNPTDKNGEGIKNQSEHLLCYTVRSDRHRRFARGRGQDGREVYTNNQFGPLEGEAQWETELCVPSMVSDMPDAIEATE